MTTRSKRRVRKSTTIADQEILAGLRTLSDYQPQNKANSVEALSDLEQQLIDIHAATLHVSQQLAALYEQKKQVGQQLHDGVQGAKNAVIAQYGPDAQEVRLLGLKRKSDYRLPKKRTTPA